jgi:hypothetical protein
MGNRHATRKGSLLTPLDEERKRRVCDRLLDAGRPPPEELAAWCTSRPGCHSQAEPFGLARDVACADGPAEGPVSGRDPATEGARHRLGLIHDRHELEIGLAKRHDAVRGSPPRMAPTLDARQRVSGAQFTVGRRKIADRDQDVVDLQREP